MTTDELALPSGAGSNERLRTSVIAGLLALVAVFVSVDVVEDSKAGSLTVFHITAEIAIVALFLVAVVVLIRGLRVAEASAVRLGHDLAAAQAEADRFRAEAAPALSGLATAIDQQFERWGLTQAEREIALLLLRGLSHREVADARHTNEATVRQQALAVYRKSGLRSRSELSAFFLRDLLLPSEAPMSSVERR
jgi:DNA-binding CsgD family transcriptional regulator